MSRPALARALTQHRTALAECRRCVGGLPEARPVISLARAPRVMLVGQAPGKTEIVERRPFAGRAGRTLFQWIAEAGLDEVTARRAIYIAAITRCFPGAHPSGRGDRVPSRTEQDACSGWLDAELRLIRPRILIPVGKLAIERFLPRSPLDAIIGREHEVEHEGGRSLAIPLPHPSGASSWIHMPGHRALVERAIALLRRRLGEVLTRAAVVLAALLLASSAAGAQARAPDRWFGADKVKHLLMTGFVYGATHAGLQFVRADGRTVTTGAFAGAALAAVGKEVFDRRRGGPFSVRDLVWDAAGGSASALLMKHTRR